MKKSRSWTPPVWDDFDVGSLQALQRGDADEDQQKRALRFIIENVCGTYEMQYRPDEEGGRRDTDFGLGRQFVGQQIVKLLNLNLSALRRAEQ